MYVVRLKVGAADIDELGHVGNEVYLRWMMRAAREHSDALGYTFARYRELGAVFVVRRHELDYLAEGKEGDELEIRTWCGEVEKVTAARHYRVVRARDGRELARGITRWVFVSLESGRPQRIPEDVARTFAPETATPSGLPSS
jgi:acyl-CoA thioester hydrolase